MLDLSTFSDTCSYCFRGIQSGISVCYCGNSLCGDHLELHTSKFDCDILYSLDYDDNQHIRVSGAQEDTGDLEERINIRVKNGMVQSKHTSECVHVYTSNNIELVIDASTVRCAMCDLQDNLWVCLECGSIGCGRVQPGVQGNGHALAHFNSASNACSKVHGQVVLLSSIKDGCAETFCYLCQKFVYNPYKLNIHCPNLNSKGFNEIAGSEQTSDPSSITGIVNEGQNCYISAVLHLVSTMLKNVDLRIHFELCESNPMGCFCCQLVKVLNELRDISKMHGPGGANGGGIAAISISGFLKLVFCSEMFVQYKQEDCSEFLQYILESITGYEDCMLLPKITSILGFDVKSCSRCEQCDFVSMSTCQNNILYVPYTGSLDGSVAEYFKPSESLCKCGGRITHSSCMPKVPAYLIVSVMRYRIEDHRSVKIEDPIEAGTLDLSEFVSRDGASECVMSLAGCIVHKGKETSSGHYTWWAKQGANSYLANDDIVTKSTDEWSKNGTVFLLSKYD